MNGKLAQDVNDFKGKSPLWSFNLFKTLISILKTLFKLK